MSSEEDTAGEGPGASSYAVGRARGTGELPYPDFRSQFY